MKETLHLYIKYLFINVKIISVYYGNIYKEISYLCIPRLLWIAFRTIYCNLFKDFNTKMYSDVLNSRTFGINKK